MPNGGIETLTDLNYEIYVGKVYKFRHLFRDKKRQNIVVI